MRAYSLRENAIQEVWKYRFESYYVRLDTFYYYCLKYSNCPTNIANVIFLVD